MTEEQDPGEETTLSDDIKYHVDELRTLLIELRETHDVHVPVIVTTMMTPGNEVMLCMKVGERMAPMETTLYDVIRALDATGPDNLAAENAIFAQLSADIDKSMYAQKDLSSMHQVELIEFVLQLLGNEIDVLDRKFFLNFVMFCIYAHDAIVNYQPPA